MTTLGPTTSSLTTRIEALIRDHQAVVWRYLRSLGCDPSLADDLTQETFVAVYQHPFEERSEGQTRSYLRTIARNRYISHLRKEGRRNTEANIDLLDAEWNRLVGDEDGELMLEFLEKCFRTLTPRIQAALDLRYGSTASREDIADTLKMSEQGVKTMLRRAREQLKTCIEKRYQDVLK